MCDILDDESIVAIQYAVSVLIKGQLKTFDSRLPVHTPNQGSKDVIDVNPFRKHCRWIPGRNKQENSRARRMILIDQLRKRYLRMNPDQRTNPDENVHEYLFLGWGHLPSEAKASQPYNNKFKN